MGGGTRSCRGLEAGLWLEDSGNLDPSDVCRTQTMRSGVMPGLSGWGLYLYCRDLRRCWGGHGNPLQYSCLENPMDRGAWWAAVHGVLQSRTRLKRLNMHACIGEGNGNPLQYSFLGNPRDGGAWWAAVAQSLWGRTESTRLKRLSSSSRKVWRVLNKKGNRIYICFKNVSQGYSKEKQIWGEWWCWGIRRLNLRSRSHCW